MNRIIYTREIILRAGIRYFFCVVSIASAVLPMKFVFPTSSHFTFNVSAQAPQKGNVRTELIRLQAQEGLTLAYFYRGISFVNFTDRSEPPANESFVEGNGVKLGGSVSRDGNDMAFDIALHTNTKEDSLGIMSRDGSAFRGFPSITAPNEICWSYDKSHLAISIQVPATQYQSLHTNL